MDDQVDKWDGITRPSLNRSGDDGSGSVMGPVQSIIANGMDEVGRKATLGRRHADSAHNE
jgi:hypothetical protein